MSSVATLLRITTVDYRTPDGRRCSKDAPGAIKTSTKSKKWYGQGVPGYPKSKRFPLATNKDVARRILDNLVRDAERGLAGMPSDARRSLSQLVDAYIEQVRLGLVSRSKRNVKPSPDRVTAVRQYLDRVISGCRWTAVSQISTGATTLAKWLDGETLSRAFSRRTANYHLKEIRRFVWWLSKRERLPIAEDCLDAVPTYDLKNHIVHARRQFTPAEMAQLLETARQSDRIVLRLTGEQRYLLYLTGFATGYRAGELYELRKESFRFGDSPCVILEGKHTKNKQTAYQPISAAVANQLAPYIERLKPGARAWPGKWTEHPVHMIKKDLSVAGIPYFVDTEKGRLFADFHSIRHSYVTSLSTAGANVAQAQRLARHSDPRLTLGTYTHTEDAELSKIAGRIMLAEGPTITGEDVTKLAIVLSTLFQAIFGSVSHVQRDDTTERRKG